MNNGFFGFPGILDTRMIEAVQFDNTGVYQIPEKARSLLIYAIAGGGGGGGGHRRTSTNNAFGGGGGGGGGWTLYRMLVDEWDNTASSLGVGPNSVKSLLITIGAGGGGGAGSATDGGTASAGSAGGNTTISFLNARGNLILVQGGAGGGDGRSTGGTGGAARVSCVWGLNSAVASGGVGGSGATSKPSAMSVGHPQQTQVLWNGGGGGGGFPNGSLAGGGQDIQLISVNTFTNFGSPRLARGVVIVAGGAANVAGADAPPINICGLLSPGFGGGGGGGSSLGGAGNGGRGFRGGGGGGGGGSSNGVAAGTGGQGGNGYVCIIAFE